MIKCIDCGKFISYSDITNDKATCYYEPDNHFGHERIEYTHRNCKEKDARDETEEQT